MPGAGASYIQLEAGVWGPEGLFLEFRWVASNMAVAKLMIVGYDFLSAECKCDDRVEGVVR